MTVPLRFLLPALVCSIITDLSFCAKGAEYLPVDLNAEWIMDVTFQSPDGTVSKGTAWRKIEELVERDGKTYYRSRTSIEGGGFPRDEYTKLVRKDDKGFHSIDERSENSSEEVEVVLPFKIGQSWRTKGGPTPMSHTVIANETLEIAGKTYRNVYRVHMKSDDGNYIQDFWEAPDVGSIKAEIKVGGGMITLTLREYKPGRKNSKP